MERISKEDFITILKEQVLVCDGAMGTRLYEKGVFINRCFEGLNLSQPDLVLEVHNEYIEAGAQIIETNTYGANRWKLMSYGLDDKVREINLKGVELAKMAKGNSNIIIAGSIGPISQVYKKIRLIDEKEIYEAFVEQAKALEEGGVDIFIIETFPSLKEIELAIKAVQSVSDQAIVAQLTFDERGNTPDGNTPEEVILKLKELGVQVGGANCSRGPKLLYDVIKRMSGLTDLPLSVQPNAGPPQLFEGRYIYLCSPEYIAEYARRYVTLGARIVGGCCGTKPEHIKEIKKFVLSIESRQTFVIKIKNNILKKKIKEVKGKELKPVPTKEKSPLANKLATRKKFVISVEISPPRGVDISRVIKAVKLLKENNIDAINIPDGPRASARLSPMALAHYIEKNIGMETILHYTCRDRNILGMQADLLGMEILGLRNILIVTGDPPKLGDYPDATAVFDVDSIGLVKIASNLNKGLDLAGNPINSQTKLHIGVGVNPAAIDPKKEYFRFIKKVEAGAEYVLTQPIFEPELLYEFLTKILPKGFPVLVGILPLISYRNAEFLHNEVPGMRIPSEIRNRLKNLPSELARKEGIKIAREMVNQIKKFPNVSGFYIMPPLGKVKLALKVIEDIL